MAAGLEQLLVVAPRFREDSTVLQPADAQGSFLLRACRHGQWVDDVFHPAPFKKDLMLRMDWEALQIVKQAPLSNSTIEVDAFMMLGSPIQENKNERPYFPFCLLLAEHRSGYLLGTEICPPLPTLDDMWAEMPAIIMHMLARYKIRPREFLVRPAGGKFIDTRLPLIVALIAKELGVSFKTSRHLSAIDRAKKAMRRFSGRWERFSSA